MPEAKRPTMKLVAPIKDPKTGRTWWQDIGMSGTSAKGNKWYRITVLPLSKQWEGEFFEVERDARKANAHTQAGGESDGGKDEVPF